MKKSKFKMAGVLVMALVFAMMIAGCDDGGGGDGGGKVFFGETLTLDGQVWIMDWDENGVTYVKFTGNKFVDSISYIGESIGGIGSITNGILDFTIDTPSDLYNIQDVFPFLNDLNNFNISPSNTQVEELVLSIGGNSNLRKEWQGKTSYEGTRFLYVDKDVIITGSGTTRTIECDCIEDMGYCDCGDDCGCDYTRISKNLNLNLKAGWNALTLKIELNFINKTETWTLSLGDSSRTRWIFYDYEGVYSIGVMNSLNSVENQENVRHNKYNFKSLFNSKH